jgi:hypothetical protein
MDNQFLSLPENSLPLDSLKWEYFHIQNITTKNTETTFMKVDTDRPINTMREEIQNMNATAKEIEIEIITDQVADTLENIETTSPTEPAEVVIIAIIITTGITNTTKGLAIEIMTKITKVVDIETKITKTAIEIKAILIEIENRLEEDMTMKTITAGLLRDTNTANDRKEIKRKKQKPNIR